MKKQKQKQKRKSRERILFAQVERKERRTSAKERLSCRPAESRRSNEVDWRVP